MSPSTRTYSRNRPVIAFVVIVLLGLLLAACDSSSSQNTQTKQTTSGGNSFPTKAPSLRTPAFGSPGQVASTVKVLASVDPTLIVQFPLTPASIKSLFPKATALVTVFQNPVANDFDTVTVDVQDMPPNVKFTVFFTELSAKPFGHAEYVGDVIPRGVGRGEQSSHLSPFVAFPPLIGNPAHRR